MFLAVKKTFATGGPKNIPAKASRRPLANRCPRRSYAFQRDLPPAYKFGVLRYSAPLDPGKIQFGVWCCGTPSGRPEKLTT